MIYNSQEELDEALALWQKRLRLQDWEVRARIVTRKQMEGDSYGRCFVHWDTKQATIRILHPEFYEDEKELDEWGRAACNHERVLVHELLHIPFHPLMPSEEGMLYSHIEQVIESLASSFVEVRPVVRTLVQ